MNSNREEDLVFRQPKLFEERRALARVLVERLQYRLPLAIDAMDNAADKAFAAWPERIYVVAPGGRIAYKGDMGPFGFHPEKAESALSSLVGSAAVSD
jgi:hypothetical protein